MPIIYDDEAFIVARIAALEARIVAYENAALAVAGGAASYSFDDGQIRQTVTRHNLSNYEDIIRKLIADRDAWLTQLRGGGAAYVRPGF